MPDYAAACHSALSRLSDAVARYGAAAYVTDAFGHDHDPTGRFGPSTTSRALRTVGDEHHQRADVHARMGAERTAAGDQFGAAHHAAEEQRYRTLGDQHHQRAAAAEQAPGPAPAAQPAARPGWGERLATGLGQVFTSPWTLLGTGTYNADPGNVGGLQSALYECGQHLGPSRGGPAKPPDSGLPRAVGGTGGWPKSAFTGYAPDASGHEHDVAGMFTGASASILHRGRGQHHEQIAEAFHRQSRAASAAGDQATAMAHLATADQHRQRAAAHHAAAAAATPPPPAAGGGGWLNFLTGR